MKTVRFFLCVGSFLCLVFLAVVLFAPSPVHAESGDAVGGAIASDTTWSAANSPYVVTGDVFVNAGAILSIEPGVVVEFDGNFAIVVMGSLRAVGTEEQPVRFTSGASSPAPGDWSVIDFRAESTFNRLEHVVVEYGGNASRPGWMCVAGELCVGTSEFFLDRSTVQKSATRGLVLVQSDATISNSEFDQNADEAIRLHGCNTNIGPCMPAIVGNRFTNNASPVVRSSGQNPHLAGNTATSNGVNGIIYTTPCVFSGDHIWSADELVYVVQGEICGIGGFGPASLTIEPGTVVKFGSGAGLGVSASAFLTATGTAEQPIVFTSLKDDSVGGDTNGDGTGSSPAVDDWSLILVSGTGAHATLENVHVQYAGQAAIDSGPLLLADYGGTLVVRDSELKHGETGIAIMRGANVDVRRSLFEDLSFAGVDSNSDGTVTIADSSILGAKNGLQIADGKPAVQGNLFEGNETAVTVVCSRTHFPNCVPVISPHNRFNGKDQAGVVNRYPMEGCVDATQNWWGHKSGPADASAALDACQLDDNPGSGAIVSDGVNYSPWDGGVARPIISWPGCGVTAVNQPRFMGRAQAGATVTIYDGESVIGSGMCKDDHSFVIDSTEILADGEHTVTAIAAMDGEESLVSRPLALAVDSSLTYDPAGILIVYEYHSVVYTQTLRDESGCAPAFGDPDMELPVLPGSTMKIIVPMREDLAGSSALCDAEDDGNCVAQLEKTSVFPAAAEAADSEVDWKITNNSGKTITGIYLIRGPDTDQAPNLDDVSLGGGVFIRPGDVRTFRIDGGYVNGVMIESEPGTFIYRYMDQTWVQNDSELNVPWVELSDLSLYHVHNFSKDNKIDRLFLATGDSYGPNLLRMPIDSQGDKTNHLYLRLPRAGYAAMAQYADGTWELQDANLRGRFLSGRFDSDGPGRTIALLSEREICKATIGYYDDIGLSRESPNLVRLISGVDRLNAGQPYEFKIKRGTYTLRAYDCTGKLVDQRTVRPTGEYVWDIGKPCQKPGRITIQDNLRNVATAFFTGIYTGLGGYPGNQFVQRVASYLVPQDDLQREVYLELCDQLGRQTAYKIGALLIDPDGYVYDEALGIEHVIPGATVTCDEYDEDYGTWFRWPAEIYENQINPQVTGDNGYYAFFVPPGLYRVRAAASGYESHTSPDIRVVDEIVHYNVPMTGGGGSGALFLPAIQK